MFKANEDETFDLDDDFFQDAFLITPENIPKKQFNVQSIPSKTSISKAQCASKCSPKHALTLFNVEIQNGTCETSKKTSTFDLEKNEDEIFQETMCDDKNNYNVISIQTTPSRSEMSCKNNSSSIEFDDDMDSIFNFDLHEDFPITNTCEPPMKKTTDLVETNECFPISNALQKKFLPQKQSLEDVKGALSSQLRAPNACNQNKISNLLNKQNCVRNLASVTALTNHSVSENNSFPKEKLNCSNSERNVHIAGACLNLNNLKKFTQSPLSPFNKSHCTTNKMRKRKFPGPAGILPILPPGADFSAFPQPEKPLIAVDRSSAPQEFLLSQSTVDEFEKSPWQTMLKDIASENDSVFITDNFNIEWVLQQAGSKQLPNGKVPALCVILKSLSCKGSEASATFVDKTGEMSATVHRDLYEEYHEKLLPGTVLVLKQVTVFSPSLRKHYLIINPKNVVSIYGAGGDKTTIIPCDGHQLASMASHLMQEMVRSPQVMAGRNVHNSPHFSYPKSPLLSPAALHQRLQTPPGIQSESLRRKMHHNMCATNNTKNASQSVSAVMRGNSSSNSASPTLGKNNMDNSTKASSKSNESRCANANDFCLLEEGFNNAIEENTSITNDVNVSRNSNEQPNSSKRLHREDRNTEACDFFEDDFDSLLLNMDDKDLFGDISS